MNRLESREIDIRKIWGSFGPALFSIGFIYLVAWMHAFTFLEQMGAAWYIGNVSILWMLSVSRYTFTSFFMLIIPISICVVALKRFKIMGKIVLLAIAFWIASALSIAQFTPNSIKVLLSTKYIQMATLVGASLVLTFISAKVYVSRAVDTKTIVIWITMIVMIPTQRASLEAELSTSKPYFKNGIVKLKTDTAKYQVISVNSEDVLLKENGTNRFYLKSIDVLEYVGD